jgi:hypothetical protein
VFPLRQSGFDDGESFAREEGVVVVVGWDKRVEILLTVEYTVESFLQVSNSSRCCCVRMHSL